MVSLVRFGDEPNSVNLSEYVIDSVNDVNLLPTAKHAGARGEKTCYPGSQAYTSNLAHIYILGNDDMWHEV